MKFFEQKLTTVFADNNLKIESYKNELSNVFDSWRMEIFSNHIFLTGNAIIKNEDSKRTNLHNVLGGSPKLVFRITDDISSCYDCKDKILNELKELSKTIRFPAKLLFHAGRQPPQLQRLALLGCCSGRKYHRQSNTGTVQLPQRKI